MTERRNYVLREMWQNGYIDEATYLAEKDMPLRSVQNGDFPPSARACRRATISPTRSAASFPAPSARRSSSAAACRFARRWTPTCRGRRRGRCARGWRSMTAVRASGAARGKVIDPSRLGSEADWRAALAETEVPRDIAGWYPAVVLEVGDSSGPDRDRECRGGWRRPFHSRRRRDLGAQAAGGRQAGAEGARSPGDLVERRRCGAGARR